MSVGRPHPNSLANLRPPFSSGNQMGRHNNPWLKRSNELREDLWKAATPEVRAAMAKQLCEFMLGTALEPVFDDDGLPVTCADGSPKLQALPPARRADMIKWATNTFLDCCGGSFSFKSIEANVTTERADGRERMIEAAAALLTIHGGRFADLVPPELREIVTKGAKP